MNARTRSHPGDAGKRRLRHRPEHVRRLEGVPQKPPDCPLLSFLRFGFGLDPPQPAVDRSSSAAISASADQDGDARRQLEPRLAGLDRGTSKRTSRPSRRGPSHKPHRAPAARAPRRSRGGRGAVGRQDPHDDEHQRRHIVQREVGDLLQARSGSTSPAARANRSARLSRSMSPPSAAPAARRACRRRPSATAVETSRYADIGQKGEDSRETATAPGPTPSLSTSSTSCSASPAQATTAVIAAATIRAGPRTARPAYPVPSAIC